ncbi:hypothetical protein BO71DRAFT_482058 [Aspergillus ellipticus CBS 707.79]|uniref:Uncharacterized protein n=1 Tax=Aspergillus ellipticus CBS 707.79 TaxID=1448320 RepID=A0A319DGJ0_9EURO|nr:hypothetical protein BO71DRAFT_482058 [Aspergillus ellipticus CBS 707.79]
MPPSAVFSYWRRDHRRSSPSPVSSAIQPSKTSNSPQIPLISNTTTSIPIPGASPGDGVSPQAPSDSHGDLDAAKRNVAIAVAPSNAPDPSTNLAVPTSENETRPHSCPEDRDQDPAIVTQSSYSQSSFAAARSDNSDSDSPKTSSPFRLSLSKGLLASHNLSSDGHSKRSSTPAGHFRFRASPDISPADKTTPSQKDYKYEGAGSRRHGDRDASTEPTHHRSGKTRLHLLNPMSLLARRRSSQLTNLRMEETSKSARNIVPAIPDDYDPRIRGKIVHDFSAPRPRRNLSVAPVLRHEHDRSSLDAGYNGDGKAQGQDQVAPVKEQRKRQTQYSPVFKEHFEDDQKVLQVENKAYLQSSLLTGQAHVDSDPSALPVFARKLPSKLPDQPTTESPSDQTTPKQDSQHNTPAPAPAPAPAPPTNVEDADTIEVIPHQPTGLPKHLKSNASRFSFDMNGVESSAQEKLLEEKHKEKEAARRAKARMDGEEFSDDDLDDMFDDMDDFEEKIPGVNVDADDADEFADFSGPGPAFNRSWIAPGLSPVIASPLPPEISNLQGLQDPAEPEVNQRSSEDRPALMPEQSSPPDAGDYFQSVPVAAEAAASDSVNGPGAANAPQSLQPSQPSQPMDNDDDDDLYFDDGEFGDLTTDDAGEKFDESIFDDETSHLYARKTASQPAAPAPAPAPEQAEDTRQSLDSPDAAAEQDEFASEPGHEGGLRHVPSMASDYRRGSIRTYTHTLENIPNVGSAKAHGGVLSEHNLEAFHNALAQAANDAATNDRFGHTTSVSERSMGQESAAQTMDTPSGLISDDSHLSQTVDMVGFDEVFEDFSYDDTDDFFDDPIIAAANAEALENDDEGIYGQEFGFYAQSHGGCNGELTNGGYFGPRGVEGITRSFSSRGKFCEPSLTPITERSEWSTRNSVISLTAHGAAHSRPLSSPGLAQLVDLGAMDDEMSLSALMKLRRGAWGGSNGSLRSSSGSPPPHLHSSSNRASFISDASPTVYTAPPDAFGQPSATESPVKDGDKFKWPPGATEQRVGLPSAGDRES